MYEDSFVDSNNLKKKKRKRRMGLNGTGKTTAEKRSCIVAGKMNIISGRATRILPLQYPESFLNLDFVMMRIRIKLRHCPRVEPFISFGSSLCATVTRKRGFRERSRHVIRPFPPFFFHLKSSREDDTQY